MTLGSRPGHQALYPCSDQIFHGNCPQGAAGPWIRQLSPFKSNLWARTQQRVFNWSQHFWQLWNGSLHPEGELGYLGGPPTYPAEEMTSNVTQPPSDRSDCNSQLGLSGVPPLTSPLSSPRPLVMVLFCFIFLPRTLQATTSLTSRGCHAVQSTQGTPEAGQHTAEQSSLEGFRALNLSGRAHQLLQSRFLVFSTVFSTGSS